MAQFYNGVSVLGRILERGIKNWPISRMGCQFYGNLFLERGANLESRAAHTHPKNTEVPPPPGGQTPKVVAYYTINILYSFRRGSEFQYKYFYL